jgi:aryl carrier-like protein
VPGEVFVGGEGLARGYLNRPELTAERFLPDNVTKRPGARLYKTGDLARILPSGDIEYLGRIDHQVKIRGFRIELGEIESVLCQHPTVREAVVIAREDESGSKRLTAYVVAQPATALASDLREYLKLKLPDYMLPAAFVILDKFPLTASGKIDRKVLPDLEQHRLSKAEDYAAPQSLIEKQLASIWSKVLNLRQVGVDENFFDLGGDSVLIVQVHARLREELGVNLPIVGLFEHSTIRALGRHLSEVSNSSANTRELQGHRAQRQKDALAQIRAKQRSK